MLVVAYALLVVTIICTIAAFAGAIFLRKKNKKLRSVKK